jgi:hypothetical protein
MLTGTVSFSIFVAAIWTTITQNPFKNLPMIKVCIDRIYIIKHEKMDKILKVMNTFFLLYSINLPAKIAPNA